MSKWLALFCMLALSITVVSPAAAQTAPTITLLNPPPGGVLELNVGESYTFQVQFDSSEPFTLAQVGLDQYYPGRYIFSSGIVSAHQTSSTVLTFTITAKEATAELPGGVAPVTLTAAVRYPKNDVHVEYFPINIIVK